MKIIFLKIILFFFFFSFIFFSCDSKDSTKASNPSTASSPSTTSSPAPSVSSAPAEPFEFTEKFYRENETADDKTQRKNLSDLWNKVLAEQTSPYSYIFANSANLYTTVPSVSSPYKIAVHTDKFKAHALN